MTLKFQNEMKWILCKSKCCTVKLYLAWEIWTNEINFNINHALNAGSFAWPVDLQSRALSLCHGCPCSCLERMEWHLPLKSSLEKSGSERRWWKNNSRFRLWTSTPMVRFSFMDCQNGELCKTSAIMNVHLESSYTLLPFKCLIQPFISFSIWLLILF